MSLRPSLATVVLAGAAAMVALFAAWAARLVKALHAHAAPSHDLLRPALVLAALLLLAILLAAGTRLPPRLRANLALSVASTVAALYAAEAALALASPERARLREKLAVLQSMRSGGSEPSPGVEPVRFVWLHAPGTPESLLVDGRPTLPLAGISRRRTVDCKEGGGWLIYDTDERGFHNPPGLWSLASVDVAVLGDSFVHGSCVPSEDNMVARVRRRRPATLNLGTPGAGPLILLAQLREYMPALRPRTVVWCHFSGNDLLDLRRERGHALLARYLQDGYRQGLDAARQPALDGALERYVRATLLPDVEARASRRLAVPPLLALRRVRSAAGLALAEPYALAPSEDEYALFARVLGEARRTVERWGGRLVFVYLPAWKQEPRQLGEAEYQRVQEAVAQRARAIVRGMGLPLVDVEALFAAQPDPARLYGCPGCHYEAAGYALAGDAILSALDEGAR